MNRLATASSAAGGALPAPWVSPRRTPRRPSRRRETVSLANFHGAGWAGGPWHFIFLRARVRIIAPRSCTFALAVRTINREKRNHREVHLFGVHRHGNARSANRARPLVHRRRVRWVVVSLPGRTRSNRVHRQCGSRLCFAYSPRSLRSAVPQEILLDVRREAHHHRRA